MSVDVKDFIPTIRFVAKYAAHNEICESIVEDLKIPGRKFYFDSYAAAQEWADIANRTPC